MELIQPITKGIGQLMTPYYDTPPKVAPAVDHTINTDRGTYFLFMNPRSSAPTVYIETIAMTDLPRDPTNTFSCVRFSYQIFGNVTLKMLITPNSALTYYYRNVDPKWKPR